MKMPRVHHWHNPKLVRRSTCNSFWRWRGDCGRDIDIGDFTGLKNRHALWDFHQATFNKHFDH